MGREINNHFKLLWGKEMRKNFGEEKRLKTREVNAEPVGQRESNSLYFSTPNAVQNCKRGRSGICLDGCSRVESRSKVHRGKLCDWGIQPNAKGQSYCNLHISILRPPTTLLTHTVLIIIFKWKFRKQQAISV